MPDSGFVLAPTGRIVDVNGMTVPGGTIEFYAAGTTTPKIVYSDDDLSVALGSTVYLDSGGHPVASQGSSTKVLIYTGSDLIKMVVKDADAVTLLTYDNVKVAQDTSDLSPGGGGSGMVSSIVSKTSDYSVTSDDNAKLLNCDPTGASFTITLPSAIDVGDGFEIGIRHAGTTTANVVQYATVSNQTVALDGASAIGGALTGGGEEVWLTSNGGGWVATTHIPPRIVGNVSYFTVEARQSNPPTSPTPGTYYLINGTPAGGWSTFADGDIVRADGQGNWIRHRPFAHCGWKAYIRAESLETQYQATDWVDYSNVTAPTEKPLRALVARNVQPFNTSPSSNASGDWRGLVVNTLEFNTITTANGASADATLSSNAITLPAGTYEIDFEQVLTITGSNTSGVVRTRITNLTTSSYWYSETEQITVPSGLSSSTCRPRARAIVTVVASQETFSFELRCTNTTNGGVVLALGGVTEQFATVVVTDLSAQQGPRGLQGAQGPNIGLDFAWTTSVSGDPGVGHVGGNNATLSSITQINISKTGRNGEALGTTIGLWDDSSNVGNKGHLRIISVPTRTSYIELTVTGALTDNTTYWSVPVTVSNAGGTLAADDTVGLLFSATGNGNTEINAQDYASINAAVAAIGGTSATLVVSTSCTLAASLTVPSNIALLVRKGGLIVKASTYTLTINGPFQAGIYRVFSGFSDGNVTFGGPITTWSEWWGATGDGVTDDLTALQSAVTAITTRGHLQLESKDYYVSNSITVSRGYTGIKGRGKTWTRIYHAAGATSGILNNGTWPTAIARNEYEGFYLARLGAGTGGVGLQLFRCANVTVRDVHVADFLVGVLLLRATNTVAERVITSFSLGSTSSFVGFDINCSVPQTITVTIASPGVVTLSNHGYPAGTEVWMKTTGAFPTGLAAYNRYYIVNPTTSTFQLAASVGGAAINTSGSQSGTHTAIFGGPGGNASSVFRDCWSDAGGQGGSSHIGFKAYGAYVSDLLFDAPETASTHTGFSFDFTNSFNAGNEDNQLINPRADFYTTAGIDVLGTLGDNNETMLTIMGGWMDPKSVGAPNYGIRCQTVRGVKIIGTQFFAEANNAGYSRGLLASGSKNVTASDCLFTNQYYGAVFDGCDDCASSNNRYFSNSTYPSLKHVQVTGTSNRIKLVGDIIDGYATTGVEIGASAAETVLAAVSFNGTNLSTKLSNSGVGTRVVACPGLSGLSTIASASTTDLGSLPDDDVTISGTTTITSFGSTAATGAVKFLEFSGALTLTHNGTSLILPGGANITTVAGDCATVRYEGSGNWRVLHYTPKTWTPMRSGLTSYTPTVTAGAGSLGTNPPTATGAYYDLGPLRFVQATITFPASYSAGGGTASSDMRFTTPSAPVADFNNGVGREIAVAGHTLFAYGFSGNTAVRVQKLSDLSFVGGNSYVLDVQIFYRTV